MNFELHADTVPKTQTLEFYQNYMAFAYNLDCGKYLVRSVPSYPWLTFSATGGAAYLNELQFFTTNPDHIGKYPLAIEIYQNESIHGYRYETPAPGAIPTLTF